MNGPALSTAIKTTLSGQGFIFDPGAPNTKFVDALCDALVLHIQTTAIITVASVSGVTPGGGVSGPGIGTIT
jgi:hypothetical protein